MAAPACLIYGGKGALGNVCVKEFKRKGWRVLSVDLVAHEEADGNVVLVASHSWIDQARKVDEGVAAFLTGATDKLTAVMCVAGGWAGGNAAASELINSADLMWRQSVWTSVIAGQIASKHLTSDGLYVTCGARPALGGTPQMIGYGMAKAAVHQLVKSLASEKSGVSSDATVLAILPVTLDTPNNRKFMPNADTSTWTPLEQVADYFFKWATEPKSPTKPASGSLVTIVTEGGETTAAAVA
eukprot:m.242267 g.242267  ORF g.242267 m.242267 type:complete len:242 (-) comp19439_c0_seq1:249-974(-)